IGVGRCSALKTSFTASPPPRAADAPIAAIMNMNSAAATVPALNRGAGTRVSPPARGSGPSPATAFSRRRRAACCAPADGHGTLSPLRVEAARRYGSSLQAGTYVITARKPSQAFVQSFAELTVHQHHPPLLHRDALAAQYPPDGPQGPELQRLDCVLLFPQQRRGLRQREPLYEAADEDKLPLAGKLAECGGDGLPDNDLLRLVLRVRAAAPAVLQRLHLDPAPLSQEVRRQITGDPVQPGDKGDAAVVEPAYPPPR